MYSCFRLQKHKLCTCTVSLPSEVCNVYEGTLARKKIYHRLDRFLSRVNSAPLGIPCRHRHPGSLFPWGLASPGLRLPGASPPRGSVAIPCWHRFPGASSVREVSTSSTSSSPFLLLLGEEAVCLSLSLGVGWASALGPWVTSL